VDILEKVARQGLLLDGAMGSMLIRQGLRGNEAAELWNIEHPDIITRIHRAYFDAGADVASANTYGACSAKLRRMGLEDQVERLNREGVRLARKACGKDRFVAGDMGALDAMLQPAGPISFQEAVDSFAGQAGILEDEGVDLFLVETIFDITVAFAAIQAIRSVSKKPVFCSLTFKQMKKGFFTLFGNPPGQSMKALADAGASAVGANCTIGSGAMIDLAREIRGHATVPVITQPNAGMPAIGTGPHPTYPEDPDFFARNIKTIRDLGVEIVGGCCGTTPDHIRKIRELL
jgi:methionine synthase I (cobalamin-dependent)